MVVEPPLRFVVVADGPTLLPWQAECVRLLTATNVATVIPAVAGTAELHATLATADVSLTFSRRPLDESLLALPRLGVWAFSFGAPGNRPGPPGFAEVRAGAPVVQASLVRLTRDGFGTVLHEGAFPTKPHSYGWTRNAVLGGVAPWVAKAVKDAVARVPLTAQEQPVTWAPVEPGLFAMAGLVLRTRARFLRAQLRGIARGAKWNVGVVPLPIAEIADGPLSEVRWFPQPERGAFLADPFPVTLQDRTCVIAEYLRQREGRGTLSVYDLHGNPLKESVPELDAHLSYPFTFIYEGQTYCVPESAQARAVRLFRLDEAGGWVDEGEVVSDRKLLDPTIFEYQGRWWLFATDAELGGRWSLHAWWAPTPLGPWQEHAANPIKSDVRSARPAGTPYWRQGKLIRPAQDCSGSYGAAVVLNEVVELSPTRFRERVVGRIEPSADFPEGLHTLSSAGPVTLVDGKRSELSWGHARREILGRLARVRPPVRR
jgi:hypothetical protein